MRATQESPSGAARMVAGPFTRMDQSFGATKELPKTVVLGVSAESRSDPCALAGLLEAGSEEASSCAQSSCELNAKRSTRMSFFMARKFNLTSLTMQLNSVPVPGSPLLPFLLVAAAQAAARVHPSWRRRYVHPGMQRHKSIAKVAMGRRLAVCLNWMWRMVAIIQRR
jgi:hypothetical protein